MLAYGLYWGLDSGLSIGFSFMHGLAVGIANGIVLRLELGLAKEFAFGLALGLAFGPLPRVFAFELDELLIFGLAFGVAWYLSYVRLYFYPLHFIRSLCGVDFYLSPYHKDAVIRLPIYGVEKQFRRLALTTPEDALKFVRFLREYRPLQTKLADSIAHAACAGTWLNHPLAFDFLQPPLIENDHLKPSDDWLHQLQALKEQLVAYRHQMQPSFKREYFQHFLKQLGAFRAQTLAEHRSWKDEYLQALALWQKVALEEQQQLEDQAKEQEPITANVYLSGEALRPDTNDKVFLGRDDLKDELARRIYSSQQMPLFLIQGQRRVGKTSLLNFLEPLLGSGFRVVYQDLQDARVSSIQTWLADLQARIIRKLDLSATPPVHDFRNHDWLTAWRGFEMWLQSLKLDNSYKLILAFDEYEELHRLLQENAEQGARLLAAMRSFSQHQNHILFLFVGSALFTELKNPHWGQYFVQAQTFRVDYLSPTDALRLITDPVSLIYPPELPEQMVVLTKGHPALLQLLCSEMVNIANRTPKKNMSQADLDYVVQQIINDSSTAPMALFWQQFSSDSACKKTVREIIHAQPPDDKKQLHRLREHGFIIQDDRGLWHLRVPLFERWLRAFDRVDLD
jgi:hypothetical protein